MMVFVRKKPCAEGRRAEGALAQSDATGGTSAHIGNPPPTVEALDWPTFIAVVASLSRSYGRVHMLLREGCSPEAMEAACEGPWLSPSTKRNLETMLERLRWDYHAARRRLAQ